MGGGDLNLKKSWHPHTMKNQERVWKAEQEKKQEEEKLRDLRKEIEEERSREDLKKHGQTSGVLDKPQDKKMEWMYKNSKELINREEYLLGRTIDKTFEQLAAEEKQANVVGMQKPINHVEHECIPFSIRNYKDANTTEQVDLQRKRMEDPLLLIKEKEMESRRKLLENPVRLKELHRLLKQDQELKQLSKQRKAKKSKKSKKKKKKKSKSDSSSSDSDDDSVSDLDERLRHKYEKLKGAGNKNEDDALDAGIAKLLGSKYDAITRHLDEMVKKNKKKKKRRDSTSSSEDSAAEENRRRRNREDSRKDSRHADDRRGDRRRSRSPRHHDRRSEDRRRSSRSPQRRHKELGRNEKESRQAKRHSSRSASREYSRRKSRSRSPLRNRPSHRSRSRSKDRSRRRSKSPAPKNPFANQRKNSPPPAKPTAKAATKLSEEEKEARRREMMQNAAWREADRSQAVQKHREAYAREEQQHKDADFDKDFLNKQVKKAISNQTSVGSRLRANLNNIQRMASSMDSNFARK